MDVRPEPALEVEDDLPDATCNSPGFCCRFIDKCSDLDAHESKKIPIDERDDLWGDLHRKKVQDNIQRVMIKKREQALQKEKKEFKSKFLRTISKGGRAALYLVSPMQKN